MLLVIKMRIRRIISKIKKIIDYIPILWNDEDWDFEYLLLLLRFKLDKIKDCIHKNDIIVKHEQREIFIGINQAIQHIDNYCNDNAFSDYAGKLPFEIDFKSEKNNDGYYNLITLNKQTQKPLTQEENELYDEYLINKINFQQKEWELIFDTIKQEGQKWWD